MATAPTQPEPAEGERDDDRSADQGSGQGVSTQEPAEGTDDAPAGGAGSPH